MTSILAYPLLIILGLILLIIGIRFVVALLKVIGLVLVIAFLWMFIRAML